MSGNGEASGAAAEPDTDDEGVYEPKYKLTTCQMMTYSHLRLTLSAMDLTLRPARFAVYVELMRMRPAIQAALVSGAKSLDLILGFALGKLSDSTRSKYGRRRPFIMVCFPICLFAFLMFNSPSLFFNRANEELMACSNETEAIGLTDRTCPQLQSCLESNFGMTATRKDSNIVVPEVVALSGFHPLSFYFFIFYFLYYVCGWTGTAIPYDALGMELTDDSQLRLSLFGVRVAFQLVGYVFPIGLQMVLNGFMADDVPMQHFIMAIVFSIWGIVAVTQLLVGIKERPAKDEAKTPVVVPIVPEVSRMAMNMPYRMYLYLRCPLNLSSLMPTNLLSYYIKFVMGREGYIGIQSIGSMIFLFAAVSAIRPLVMLGRKFLKQRVLACVVLVQGCMLSILFILPGSVLNAAPWLLFILMASVGVTNAAMQVIPDPLLADIIDYHELRTGDRSEGMYTVMETNLVQLVEIVGGVLPLLVFDATGYQGNGGCTCGCGISCVKEGMPFARWHCPNDVGFSCTGDLGTDLLFGGDRTAPCTFQSSSVEWMIKLFFAGIPAICSFLALYPMWYFPITPKTSTKVLKELDKRANDPEYVCNDPILGGKIKLPTNSDQELFREHFSLWERTKASGVDNPTRILKKIVGGQIFIIVAIGVVLAVITLATQQPEMLTLANTLGSALFLFLCLHTCRFRALRNPVSSDFRVSVQPGEPDPSTVGSSAAGADQS